MPSLGTRTFTYSALWKLSILWGFDGNFIVWELLFHGQACRYVTVQKAYDLMLIDGVGKTRNPRSDMWPRCSDSSWPLCANIPSSQVWGKTSFEMGVLWSTIRQNRSEHFLMASSKTEKWRNTRVSMICLKKRNSNFYSLCWRGNYESETVGENNIYLSSQRHSRRGKIDQKANE